MSDEHLSPAELSAWRDGAEGDRLRIVAHLAGCEACRRLAAELERERPASGLGTRFDPADFVERGYREGTPTARDWRWSAGAWLGAAAALLIVVLVPLWVGRLEDGSSTLRGAGPAIALVQPVTVAVRANELVFEWTAPPEAPVRLTVVDLDNPGEPVIDRDVTGPRYVPTDDERQRLRPGQSLHWFIDVRGRAGGTSPAARFQIK